VLHATDRSLSTHDGPLTITGRTSFIEPPPQGAEQFPLDDQEPYTHGISHACVLQGFSASVRRPHKDSPGGALRCTFTSPPPQATGHGATISQDEAVQGPSHTETSSHGRDSTRDALHPGPNDKFGRVRNRHATDSTGPCRGTQSVEHGLQGLHAPYSHEFTHGSGLHTRVRVFAPQKTPASEEEHALPSACKQPIDRCSDTSPPPHGRSHSSSATHSPSSQRGAHTPASHGTERSVMLIPSQGVPG